MILIWRSHKDHIKIAILTYAIIDPFILQAWVSLHTVLKTANLKSCQQRFLNKPPNIMVTNNSAYTVYSAKHSRKKTFAVFHSIANVFLQIMALSIGYIIISLQACYHANFPANNHFHSKIQVSPLNVLLYRANFWQRKFWQL